MSLLYNLQFFAQEGTGGEKTEPATQKKLQDARKEGQVAKSREIGNGMSILALFILLKLWVGYMGELFINVFRKIYGNIPTLSMFYYGNMPDNDSALLMKQAGVDLLLLLGPILLVGVLIAFLCDAIQVGWHPTAKPLMPKLSHLNPSAGFKRIFSLNSLIELIKSICKIILIGYISYSYLKDNWPILFQLYSMSLLQALSVVGNLVTDLGIRIAAVYMILALADFAYQKLKFAKDMRMTKQEVKDEFKQTEGNPEVKGRIRQRMMQSARRGRMLKDVETADVIITNPTHYAVALVYDPQKNDAPVVVAKGADYLALKIKEIGKEHDVEIVENKPTARMLYANVDIGQAIPPELFQAVADILAYVWKLKGKTF